MQDVVTGAAAQHVRLAAADQHIVAGLTCDAVAGRATGHHVVALAGPEQLAAVLRRREMNCVVAGECLRAEGAREEREIDPAQVDRIVTRREQALGPAGLLRLEGADVDVAAADPGEARAALVGRADRVGVRPGVERRLPGSGAMVRVGPPLSASAPRLASGRTMSAWLLAGYV